jgi:tetratricopeptide (TPR) repeat protein
MDLIVSKLSDFMPIDTIEGEIIESAFLATGQSTSSLTVMANHLAHQITKNTHDLRSHVQRITLFIEDRQSTATYSALVDLFLVLESNGLALRKRVLAGARSLISDVEFTTLVQSLSLGLNTEVGLPPATQSLLTKGLGSTGKQFIQQNNESAPVFASAADEARSYIEYGQLEQAQSVLQRAIVKHPRQLELHYDLLEIFQKTGDKDQFSSSYKQLLELAIVLPPRWREMAQKFSVEIKLE